MKVPVPDELLPAERLGRVHFVGIGGAGLSAIARLMLARGVTVSGSDGVDIRAGIDYLNRLPLSLREFPVTNSSRNDIVMIPSADPGEPAQANRVLPVDERRMHKANSSPFTTDIPGEASASLYDAGRVFCGSIFTLPYWTARYYDLMG